MDPVLVEGKDYTIENGLYVFTALYLAQRGCCCKNGCRYCPYDYKRKETVAKIRFQIR